MLTVFLILNLMAEESRENIYSPAGKRDPFRAQIPNYQARGINSLQPIEKFSVDQFQLRAVLRTDRRVQAMFEDPEGNTHILSEGDYLGREKAMVSRILKSEAILTLKTLNYLGVETLYEKVVSLPEK